MNNVIDPKFFNQVAQNAHMLLGALVAFAVLLFLPHYVWYVAGGFAVLTAVKEFWYDQYFENAATRGSNLNDWLHYQLGLVFALSLYCAVYKWHWCGLLTGVCIRLAFEPWLTTIGKE